MRLVLLLVCLVLVLQSTSCSALTRPSATPQPALTRIPVGSEQGSPPLTDAPSDGAQPAVPASPGTVAQPYATATAIATPPPVEHPLRDSLVNLAHLQRLTEFVEWDGQPAAIVHIYSEAPEYGWVDAAGEGISAVDDVARAALVYLAFYERTGDPQALELARRCLNFVLRMQASDGEYYNFVYDRQGTINQGGRTSYKSWGWWAARGQWALAAGLRVFHNEDREYAQKLQQAYLLGEQALRGAIGPVGAYDEIHGVKIPAWLIGGGSDVSALALLGLLEYYQVEPNSNTRQLITNLANGIAAFQLGGPGEYPYAAHPSSTSSTALWHAWGSHQTHALAWAGKLLDRQDWIESARLEADTFFVRLLASDFINEMLPLPRRGGQIAYGTQVIVSGFWSLYQVTGEEAYARYAGLAASWLFGNNMAGVAMYDPETGRGFDGIEGPTPQRVNRNAGAESTIEALYALMLVDQDPLASRYLGYRATYTPPILVVEAESGTPLAGNPSYGRREWTGEARFSNDRYYALKAGDTISVTVNIPEEGEYLMYASHLRRTAPKPERVVEALRAPTPVTIDGDLSEWEAAQVVRVDSREQILRGGAAWPGSDQASFNLYWMWDDTNLYVAAQVRDPEHTQDETGPSVWRSDALWLYLDTRGNHSRIDVKLTLAQTPDGPQVWNWTSQAFLPNAQLAWQPAEGGYIYEAALPLESLNYLEPQAGKRLNFDAGLGFTGGFITYTGLDPDTPANLAPVTLMTSLSPATQSGEISEQFAEDVAFSVAIEGREPASVAQANSPDRDYLWLDQVLETPVFLNAGPLSAQISYAGRHPDREAIVDAFMLIPTILCKSFQGESLPALTLCYDAQTAEATWEE